MTTMNINLDVRNIATSLRFVLVTGLIAVLMIPLLLVSVLVGDREQYYREAVASIARDWGGQQRVAGPMILIPTAQEDMGDVEHFVALMPERLDMRLEARHEIRSRGIFEVPVFNVEITAQGAFAPFDVQELSAKFGTLRLERAVVAIGVSDMRGIRAAELRWRDAVLDLSATDEVAPASPGLRATLPSPGVGGAFAMKLELRGSERFSAVPVGDRSTIAMAATWPHPSFDGRFLPDEYDIGEDGFTASWSTLDLARGFPAVAHVSARGDLGADKDLGFRVVEPVSLYGSVSRSVKYGVLFVVLTLVSVLCLELATGRRFHLVQYGVTGVALALFFLTLLALAEHIGFTLGYIAAAVLLTGMIVWYAHGSTRDMRVTALAATLLTTLYAVLYLLLRLEFFALLVGTGVLLVALAMLMRVTRDLTPAPEAPGPAPDEES